MSAPRLAAPDDLRRLLEPLHALPRDLAWVGPDEEHDLRLVEADGSWQVERADGSLACDRGVPSRALALGSAEALRALAALDTGEPPRWAGAGPAARWRLRRALAHGPHELCAALLDALWRLPAPEGDGTAAPEEPFAYPYASAASGLFEELHEGYLPSLRGGPAAVLEALCAGLRVRAAAGLVAAARAHRERATRALRRTGEVDERVQAFRTLAAREHARLLPRGTVLPERASGWTAAGDERFGRLLRERLLPGLQDAGRRAVAGMQALLEG